MASRAGADLESPPNDFRSLTILPTREEMHHLGQPFLRQNVTRGAFRDCEHYLDVFFRLMREDLFRPLRHGILAHIRGAKTSVHVYEDVVIGLPEPDSKLELVCDVSFKKRPRCRWMNQMLYGSLVALSKDDFVNIIFATVHNRDLEKLTAGHVSVKFSVMQPMDHGAKYEMIESPAFYEAYQHALRGLQYFVFGENIPFHKYLVEGNTKPVIPEYIRRNASELNFAVICKEAHENGRYINVESDASQLRPEEVGLDPSQHKALMMAFKQDLVCIQGPPGTGKTFVAQQIARVLLANQNMWNPDREHPMLVVCLTNHALDQFLVGMLKYMDKDETSYDIEWQSRMIRVGTKCSEPALRQYMLSESKYQPENIPAHIIDQRNDLRQQSLYVTGRLTQVTHDLSLLSKKVLCIEHLAMSPTKSISEKFRLQLSCQRIRFDGTASFACTNDVFLHWLCNVNHPTNNPTFQPDVTAVNKLMALLNVEKSDASDALVFTKGNEVDARDLLVQEKAIAEQERSAQASMGIKDRGKKRVVNPYRFRDVRLQMVSDQMLRNGSEAFTHEEVSKIANIWELNMDDRWRLYKYWIGIYKIACEERLATLTDDYNRISSRLNEANQMIHLERLKSARVIGMTMSAAARLQPILRKIGCPVVIVEEAAEALEPHIVTSLTSDCQHAILIGDHKQLRPIPAVYELAKDYDLDVSLFERLINNNFPYAVLQNQHRMRTEIAGALMPHFYDDLRDDPSVLKYESIVGMAKNFVFINHAHPEKSNREQDQHSHMNEFEGQYSVRLAHYLLQQGYRGNQITILCTYMEQMLFMRKLAQEVLGKQHNVRIDVVDNYQGEESDIIILSFVRSVNREGKIGFLNVENRICVALSRAKMGLYCIGNIDFLADKCALWKKIKASLEEHGALSNSLEIVCQSHRHSRVINTWQDFPRNSANGGCELPCDYRLNCGHACTKICHPTSHDTVTCTEDCGRSCPNGHPCDKKCYVSCGNCKITVQATLPCGHITNKPCHVEMKNLKNVACANMCPLKLACGHSCVKKCSQPCSKTCEEMVTKQLPCGHSKLMRCYDDPAQALCNRKVEKEWSGCGHRVTVDCYVNPTLIGCPHPCGVSLPGCGHQCKGTCSGCRRGRLHVRCEETCERVLICGHVCGGKCGQACAPCQRPCETACFHSRCNNMHVAQGRDCGESCPRCIQTCTNGCRHRICTKRCTEPCDIEPCNEPCTKRMSCGHYCMGLCGEDCPEVCRKCNSGHRREAFIMASQIALGYEDDLNARFIKLPCGHCVESQGMDKWVETCAASGGAVLQITCPRCRSTVTKSRRYQRQLMQRMLDIEAIKRKILGGSPTELNAQRNAALTSLREARLRAARQNSRHSKEWTKWSAAELALYNEMKRTRDTQLTKAMITSFENLVSFMTRFLETLTEIDVSGFPHQLRYPHLRTAAQLFFGGENVDAQLRSEWSKLLECLQNRFFEDAGTATVYAQFANELIRLDRMLKVANLFLEANAKNVEEFKEPEVELMKELNALLNHSIESDGASLAEFKSLLQRIDNSFGVTFDEKMQIKKALAGVVTSWYKCPNGHLYGIGHCGFAEEVAQCPECKLAIGGMHHQLQEDNRLDRAMTGVRPHESNPFEVVYGN